MKKKTILLLAFLSAILSIFLFIFIDERKWSIITNPNISNEKSIQQSPKEAEHSGDIQSEKTTESRKVEIRINNKFILDEDKNSFVTNDEGIIKGNIFYSHSTIKEEQTAVYAFLENDNTPVKIEMNGAVDSHHIINVPKEGTLKVPFTISNLPTGDHFIYIISEKVMHDKISDPLEIYTTQETVGVNYLSVEVKNKSKGISNTQDIFTKVQKIQDLENEESSTIQVYEDSNLTKEVKSISKGNYFLTVENMHDFELKANFKLISEYETLQLQQVLVPSKSKVVVSVDLKGISMKNSARIIMVGEPSQNLNIPLPFRVIKMTDRFPIE